MSKPQVVFLFLISVHWFLSIIEPVNAQSQDASDDFEANVRPLLIQHCYECHGPEKQWNDLRVDSRGALLRGGESGPAMVPGNVDDSLLIQAVRRKSDLQMPPDNPLKPSEVEALERWVAQGAPWPADAMVDETIDQRASKQRQHWAFQKVIKPSLPTPRDSKWCSTPVDLFILKGLDSRELSPAPMADRRTLIRRATMDLWGIPPTYEEVRAFEEDSRIDAYEQLIDRLLESPLYGQHWARHWLDVARYSDTKGYVYAREERFFIHAATYRDWVVQSLNEDLPYDQFLLLQLAADQVAPDDLEAQAAMGFLTLGRRFLGVTHDIIDDRIDVVTRGTMGLTASCARCHDHKYDPIPTADYYSLYGVFQNSHEVQVPVVDSTVSNASDAYQAFATEWQKRKQALADKLKASRKEASDRVRSRIGDYLFAQTELHKYHQEGFDQVLATDDLIPTFIRRWERYLARAKLEGDSTFGLWRSFEAIPAQAFEAEAITVQKGWLSDIQRGLNHFPPALASEFQTPPKSMREVADRYAAAFQRVISEASASPLDEKHPNRALFDILFAPWSPCEVPDEGIVSTETFFDSATCTELWRLQGEVDRWINQSPLAPRHAVVLRDRATLMEPRVFKRGNPANPGQAITRHFLSILSGDPPKAFQTGSGRLEMARAIVHPENPLTARVWVNRLWMHHFGAGLVRTPSDFGLRCEPPSHPELLDYLASSLVEANWSTKAMHRMMMLSSTYRQQSSLPRESDSTLRAIEMDPENRTLSRMNYRRLNFEEMRDSMLSVSGELDQAAGGRAFDLFSGHHLRRTLYGQVDRQFLPGTFRYFDFANPDLHIPTRSETTVPQQALFALNHPFMASRANGLLKKSLTEIGTLIPKDGIHDIRAQDLGRKDLQRLVHRMFASVYQREPRVDEIHAALEFLEEDKEQEPLLPAETRDWQYGYGEIDPDSGLLKSFQPLPHFTGSSWQGGVTLPDSKLGWVQITAVGGHPGNDLQHAIVRRWIAPRPMKIRVASKVLHEPEVGDGVRCWIVSSKQGKLASVDVHHREVDLNQEELNVVEGESIDFVVDILRELNTDQHLWRIQIEGAGDADEIGSMPVRGWNSERDFSGPRKNKLSTLAQLAQVLLISNEFFFVE